MKSVATKQRQIRMKYSGEDALRADALTPSVFSQQIKREFSVPNALRKKKGHQSSRLTLIQSRTQPANVGGRGAGSPVYPTVRKLCRNTSTRTFMISYYVPKR
eukprot:PhF_6_TR526/c0_g1_i1/m.346